MESLKHLEAGSHWRAREQLFVGGAIFAEAWIVAEKNVAVRASPTLPELQSPPAPHQGWTSPGWLP